MRIPSRAIFAAGILLVGASSPLASQAYECVTTTVTVTIYHHDPFGNYYISSASRSSTVCKPLVQ